MNKPGLAFLVLLLVAGCKTAPTNKTPAPTPAGQAAQVTQTQAVSHAAKAVVPPASQAQTSATLKKEEKGSPHTGAAQNPQAQAFYERFGFRVVGRSPLDGQGNPYPLLHMAWRRA